MGDMKHYLRKMDFPSVVPEALHHMQKLWLPDCTSQQIPLMREIAEEFVFLEVDKWGKRRKLPLQPIKELRIIERINWHFSSSGNDQKTATFMFLFPCSTAVTESRLPFLAKLVSMAIALLNSSVLNYVGMWMQLYGCVSEASMYLTKSILETHIKSIKSYEVYYNLYQVSPLFCCSVMIAVTNLYLTCCPPSYICDIVLKWVNTGPDKCYAAFQMSLPRSCTYTRPQTPLPGLLYWCILSPLNKESMSYAMAVSKDKNGFKDMFSDLHLAALQCMIRARNMVDVTRVEVLPAESLIVIVETMKKYVVAAPKECLKLSLDRFAQSLEVALSSGCIYRQRAKLGELFILCCDLPYNRLLKIVLRRWTSALSTQG